MQFVYEIYQLFSSIIYKAIDYLIYEAPFIKYTGLGIEPSIHLVVVCIFFYIYRKKNILLLILLCLSIITLIINPIITVSRTNFLLMIVQLFVVVYLILYHTRSNYKKIIYLSIGIILLTIMWNFIYNSYVVRRINNSIDILMSTDSNYSRGGGVAARIGEIEGVVE